MGIKKILLLISAILFCFFITFSYFVSKEKFTQFDFNTTVKLQDHIPHKFDLPFSFFSLFGSAELTMLIWLMLTIFLSIKRFFLSAFAMLLLPLALAIELFGKLFVLHPGPPHLLYRGVIKLDLPSSYVPVNYSYPSGHVTRTAFLIIFLITYFYLRSGKKYNTCNKYYCSVF